MVSQRVPEVEEDKFHEVVQSLPEKDRPENPKNIRDCLPR